MSAEQRKLMRSDKNLIAHITCLKFTLKQCWDGAREDSEPGKSNGRNSVKVKYGNADFFCSRASLDSKFMEKHWHLQKINRISTLFQC